MYRLSGKMRESSAGKSSAFDTNYGKVWGDKSKREKFKQTPHRLHTEKHFLRPKTRQNTHFLRPETSRNIHFLRPKI